MKEYKLDIHGLFVNDAYCELLEFLNGIPAGTKKVTVVHGYRGGTVLKEMVANFVHYRIDFVLHPPHNPGESIVYLKC